MSLISELRRRNVLRVASAYAITAWLVLQVADIVLPALLLPEWVMMLVVGALVLGFPIVLILSWTFELTPEGIKRETEIDRSRSITTQTGRKLDFFIIGVLVVAVSFLLVDKFVLQHTGEIGSMNDDVIAVLPLTNLSSDVEDAFFTEGMHDDLLTQLSRVGAWRVVSRTSVERFRDTELGMPDIGSILNARNIVEGSVQRAGDRLRISVQLIDARDDRHVWAEVYDRELTAANIFTIQSEITLAIASELKKVLTAEEEARIVTAHSQNLEAYQAYLLGRDRWRRRTVAALQEAVGHFQRAIELDPDYALAYSGLADAYVFQNFYARLPHPERQFEKAREALDKALSLTDQMGEVYASEGLLNRYTGRNAEAEKAFKRALELNPSYAMTLNWYSPILSEAGRSEESVDLIMRALELEPLSVNLHYNAGMMLIGEERAEEGLTLIRKAIEIDPDNFVGYTGISHYHCANGRIDECLRWRGKAAEKDPDRSTLPMVLGLTYLDLGDDMMAEKWSAVTREKSAGSELPLAAAIALYRNDRDRAVELAREEERLRGHPLTLALLRDDDLANDLFAEARARYARHYPDIIGDKGISVSKRIPEYAIDVAYFLQQSGAETDAAKLLNEISVEFAKRPIFDGATSPHSRVRLLVLQGRYEEALVKLRAIIDTGWRQFWWYFFDHDPMIEPIRHEARFKAMRDEIARDMKTQLARVREMEASGEIALP